MKKKLIILGAVTLSAITLSSMFLYRALSEDRVRKEEEGVEEEIDPGSLEALKEKFNSRNH